MTIKNINGGQKGMTYLQGHFQKRFPCTLTGWYICFCLLGLRKREEGNLEKATEVLGVNRKKWCKNGGGKNKIVIKMETTHLFP